MPKHPDCDELYCRHCDGPSKVTEFIKGDGQLGDWKYESDYKKTELPRLRRLICWHDDKGVHRRSKWFYDIHHVQCSKCGWWHTPRGESKAWDLLKGMFGAK